MKQNFVTAVFLLAIGVMAFDAPAQTVNKWVDEDGVTHFSDQKPAGNETDVKEIEIPKGSVSEFESKEVNRRLNNVLQQMEQDRKAREAESEAQKKAKQAKEAKEAVEREPVAVPKKKKKKKKKRRYYGPYPEPLPGPFPEQYPQPVGPAAPGNNGG